MFPLLLLAFSVLLKTTQSQSGTEPIVASTDARLVDLSLEHIVAVLAGRPLSYRRRHASPITSDFSSKTLHSSHHRQSEELPVVNSTPFALAEFQNQVFQEMATRSTNKSLANAQTEALEDVMEDLRYRAMFGGLHESDVKPTGDDWPDNKQGGNHNNAYHANLVDQALTVFHDSAVKEEMLHEWLSGQMEDARQSKLLHKQRQRTLK